MSDSQRDPGLSVPWIQMAVDAAWDGLRIKIETGAYLGPMTIGSGEGIVTLVP